MWHLHERGTSSKHGWDFPWPSWVYRSRFPTFVWTSMVAVSRCVEGSYAMLEPRKQYQRWRGQSLQGSSKFQRHHNMKYLHKHFQTNVKIKNIYYRNKVESCACNKLTFGHSLIQWYHMNKSSDKFDEFMIKIRIIFRYHYTASVWYTISRKTTQVDSKQ